MDIKVRVLAVLCLTTMFMVDGCGRIQEWLNLNDPPVAIISASCTSGEAPLEVFFDASSSYDTDKDKIIAYQWDFGDGVVGEGKTVMHGYGAPGEYLVRLTTIDERGAKGIAELRIIVYEPSVTVIENEFDSQVGTEFDSGVGLKISIPPMPVKEQFNLIVRYDPSPASMSDSYDIQSVYDVSLHTTSGRRLLYTQRDIQNLKARFDFNVPANVDPYAAVVLIWASDGWRIAPSLLSLETMGGLGGELSPDRRHLSLWLPMQALVPKGLEEHNISLASWQGTLESWWEGITGRVKLAIARLENTFDCSPVYPTITESACEEKGTYIEKQVSILSPDRGFGGIWFKVDIEGSSNLIEPPQWEPPNRFEIEKLVASKGWYLSPSKDKPGVLTLRFSLEGGMAQISLDAGDSLSVQITNWMLRTVPFLDLFEGFAEFFWGVVGAVIDTIKQDFPHPARTWKDAIAKAKQLVWRLIKKCAEEQFVDLLAHHLFEKYKGRFAIDVLKDSSRIVAKKLVQEVIKPIELVTVIGNILTYDLTLASRQEGGYCAHGRCMQEVTCRPRIDHAPPPQDCTVTLHPGDSIQETIARVRPGSVICLTAGTWEENIEIEKDLTLRGASREQTKIKGKDEYKNVITIANDSEIVVVIERLTVAEARGAVGIGIRGNERVTSGKARVTLSSSQVSNNESYGIELWGLVQVSITNSQVSNNEAGGILLRNSAQVSITDSQILNNKAGGIDLGNSARASIANSQISNNKEHGIGLGHSAQVSITNSQASNNGTVGIDLQGSAQASITNSQVSNNGGYGIHLGGSAQASITSSQISNNRWVGIDLWNSARAEIRGSVIEGNGKDEEVCESWHCNGISVSHESQLKLISSQVLKNADWGVWAALEQCGYGDFSGKVTFEEMKLEDISGNNTSGNQNGMGNPGNHLWNRPDVPDGQVCLP